jgi:hypothetical protein
VPPLRQKFFDRDTGLLLVRSNRKLEDGTKGLDEPESSHA